MTPKYYIAKYIADLRRYEPRNIGVVVWSPDGIVARFVGEEQTEGGEWRVDGRKIPKFIIDPLTFRAWIDFWRVEIRKQSVRSPKSRQEIPCRSEAFLDVVAEKSRGEFLLAPAGFLLDEVTADSIDDLADYLFRSLVIQPRKLEENEPDEESLNVALEAVIREALPGINDHGQLIKNYEIECPYGEHIKETFRFSFAYKNGTLRRVYQKVPLPNGKVSLEKNIHHFVWMFEKAIKNKRLKRDQCVSLVCVPADRLALEDVKGAVDFLGVQSDVINVADRPSALAEFLSLRQAHGNA